MLSGAVPVADGLATKGLKIDGCCQICGLEGESINHVIFKCSVARQVWALSDYPQPLCGFANGSVFSNVYHLLVNTNNELWPLELRTCFPWIVWTIWKNRNLFLFKGESFSSFEIVSKIRKDAEKWFMAQKSGIEEESEIFRCRRGSSLLSTITKPWVAPPLAWYKCNIGFSWSKRNKFAGASWVLRDEKGFVLLHSRRAFSGVIDVFEARFLVLVWAIESMICHKMERVEFALEDAVLVGVVNRPQAWPSYSFHAAEILPLLSMISDWKVVLERASANRGASLIAKSVTSDCRLQSYVAISHPFWLNGVFADERLLSFV
ncbi:unnamed protein product [Microthlaspi erraticum]|uniref:Reverse transcriptase zinc-binding domain-containing protein n=1 Tax=Microthlaspi erraticum TaxID=1685480 RepID=A0A6D2HL09_9BRAS|nr:unnamed protein product [Microthlaspi erraticum]